MSKKPAPHYPEVNPNPDFPKVEEAVLANWKATDAFKRSISGRANAEEFIFYDGPPFANGLPHYGHLLTGYVKDLYARYQTMRGKRVERRFGWDCHGLPAEMGSEKELGISGRAAIEKFGIDKFNEHCRTSVMKYTKEWEDYVTRQARWVDFKNDYKTMDVNFMESVLWAFKQLYDKGLVYEAHRVMPYSWAAETPLSNFETKLDNSYREREDKAITVAFELKNSSVDQIKKTNRINTQIDKAYIWAWTTTPWTLPSNLALAVNAEGKVQYYAVLKGNDLHILSGRALIQNKRFFDYAHLEEINDEVQLTQWVDGTKLDAKTLINLEYTPLFPYFDDEIRKEQKAFRIIDGSSFVTDGDGTGIVHIAPGFGEDDQRVAAANGIEVVVPVDEKGRYTDEIFDIPLKPSPSGRGLGEGDSSSDRTSGSPHPAPLPEGEGVLSLKGLNVIAQTEGQTADEPYKPEQLKKFGLANLRIVTYLKNHYPDGTNRVIKEEQIKHNYPHCWRTDQPLIYRAMPSWYVEVTKFRDRAVELNKTINWIPEHIRDGQMGHMLATAPDWSISRNRFWGTPIPVWRREDSGFGIQDSGIKVFGSIAEMEAFFDLDACFNSSLNPESRILNPRITDLHRPFIDKLTVAKDGSKWRRVTDVFDCWFESGSMPFAQEHYPFSTGKWDDKLFGNPSWSKENPPENYPADFITEYVGQTRGWFNTLIMLSTALFDKAPFKNCICHGVVLDSETGLKYSKRLKNYKDPMEVMDKFGADALRWLMISSPVMRGQDLAVDPEGKFIRDVVRLAIKPIWNAYNFFTLYANADGIKAEFSGWSLEPGDNKPNSKLQTPNSNVMDRYILAKCKQAVETIQKSLDAYDTPAACDAVTQFFEVLNNWYIRRNKERFWAENSDADPASPDGLRRTSKQAAYDTLYTVLTTMCRAAAPLLPLTLDEIYRGLKPSPTGRGLGEGQPKEYQYQPGILIKNAKELRKNSTDVEMILWGILRNRQLEGLKFRRQHPVEKYILDFYCDELNLAIELDGGQHAEQKAYDEKRTRFFENNGIKIIRFWNNDVLENIEGVVETLLTAISKQQPSPRPSPRGRGGNEPSPNPLPEEEGLSVHLQDFPDMSAFVTDDTEIVAQMDWVRDVCNAALAIRNKVNIRVRQPLGELTMMGAPWFTNANPYFYEIIKDEINVKAISFGAENFDEVATLKLSLNNPVLGKRLPEKMKQIIPASKKGEWKQVDGTIEICGEKLLAGEYTLQLEPKPEYKDRAQALSTNDALVILDIEVTDELRDEGLARDMVRAIQQARKDGGLNVSDRIRLHLDAPADIASAISTHSAYILEQTLSTELLDKQPADKIFSAESAIDDKKVIITLAKAA